MSQPFVRRLDFSDVALYGITSAFTDRKVILEKVQQLIAGGIDAIQLRCRSLSDKDLVGLGVEIKEKCAQAGVLFIVNNRPDIALAVDADGVHLGHNDLSISFVRELVGHRKIIGVSTHSLPEALDAQKQGADYVSCGPIWATPTKPDYAPVGLNSVGLYNAALRIPFVTIGGIDEKNIDQAVNAGVKCVAMVRALFDVENPTAAAIKFKEKIKINRIKAIA